MTFNDYKQAVKDDAIQIINWGDLDYCDDFEQVYDELFVCDGVTGNGSGSYTFNTAQAEENTKDLFYDDDFTDEARSMGYTIDDLLEQGAEAIDVIARCLALSYVMAEIEDAYDNHMAEINEVDEVEESDGDTIAA